MSGCYEAPSDFSLQSAGYFSSDKKISIIAMLHFDVIVRQVMALSLERIIWYSFNGFLHVEFFVEEPFLSHQKVTRGALGVGEMRYLWATLLKDF